MSLHCIAHLKRGCIPCNIILAIFLNSRVKNVAFKILKITKVRRNREEGGGERGRKGETVIPSILYQNLDLQQ